MTWWVGKKRTEFTKPPGKRECRWQDSSQKENSEMLGWAQVDDLDEQRMLNLNLNEWAGITEKKCTSQCRTGCWKQIGQI